MRHVGSLEHTLVSKTLCGKIPASLETKQVALELLDSVIPMPERPLTIADDGTFVTPTDTFADIPDSNTAIISTSDVHLVAAK